MADTVSPPQQPSSVTPPQGQSQPAVPVQNQAAQALGQAAQLLTAKPTQPQPPVTQEEKIWAALSYVPMVALIAFLLKPGSAYVKLHGRQGLLMFLLFFFSIFLYIIFPPLGPILGGLVQLAVFVIGIFSIYQAIMGNWWKIPFLGQIADKLPIDMFTNVATQAITGQEPPQTPTVEQQTPPVEPSQPVTEQQNQQPPQTPPPVAPNPPVQQ